MHGYDGKRVNGRRRRLLDARADLQSSPRLAIATV